MSNQDFIALVDIAAELKDEVMELREELQKVKAQLAVMTEYTGILSERMNNEPPAIPTEISLLPAMARKQAA